MANDIFNGRRIVAFDIGNKRIGVAASDPFNEYAMPCDTYVRTGKFGEDVKNVADIAREKGAGIIV
ncbi:MAG TPA: Holliday junction resolvase RuvX, partial [Clostridiales bacterium]|nr:Holliday junction resolvase RuvX [Clostridiales bacterium]